MCLAPVKQTWSAAIDRLAASRGGVISHAELRALDVDPALAAREVRRGRWQRLLPGVYLTSAGEPDLRQRCHAALLHGGPRSMVSGPAGCALNGVAVRDPRVLLLLPHDTRVVDAPHCQVVRARSLPPHRELGRDGQQPLRVAPLGRCLVDALSRADDLASARALAAATLRNRGELWDLVATAAARPGPRKGILRHVMRDLEDGIRSAPEGALHDVLLPEARAGRLPPYLLNPDLYLDGELIGSPDAYFPGLGLGDEQDSREHHGSVEALDETLLRHEGFARAGLHLNHTTPTRFQRDPEAHVDKLIGLVVERRALAVPEPPGLVVLGRGPLLPDRSPWPQVPADRRF